MWDNSAENVVPWEFLEALERGNLLELSALVGFLRAPKMTELYQIYRTIWPKIFRDLTEN